ncbi:centromere protein N [Hyperolius riggenbachi]|uniref:centromere protein N n=1 Tax=Hyperolius riggenbachi TaxID=752182 RepID=UPI0035A262C1
MAAPAGSAQYGRRRQRIPPIDERVAELIKRTVQKIPLAEMRTILKAWGFLTDQDLQSLVQTRIKENIALHVVQLCEEKRATLNHAADLDIVYNHANATKKTWEVYEMSKPSDPEINHIEVSEFKASFQRGILSVMKNVTVHFRDVGDALWIRIAWGSAYMKPNQYKPTFIVYHTQTPYAFLTGLTKTARPILCQALLKAAGYTQIQEMELKSRCLDSLKDIVFKRFDQSLLTHHMKPPPVKSFTPAIVDSRVIYENLKEKERIHNLTCKTFGDGPLPKLEYASFKMETAFKGEPDVAGKIEPLRCFVKFSSPHLLESVKALALAGIADAPVSSLLTCIPHRARNVFKIQDKRPAQPTNSQADN